MSNTEFPSSWTDPRYVAAIVGVVATGALCFYAGLTQSGSMTSASSNNFEITN